VRSQQYRIQRAFPHKGVDTGFAFSSLQIFEQVKTVAPTLQEVCFSVIADAVKALNLRLY
jgi:hypothetical protein